MLYEHDIAGCLAETIGENGLEAGELGQALRRAAAALGTLKRRREEGSLPLLRLPARRDDLAELKALAEEFRRRFDHVLVLGIGGSSLGGQTLLAIADPHQAARVRFLENIDPATFSALFAAIDPARTGVIVVSKSGGTAEPLAQLFVTYDWLRQGLGTGDLEDRVVAITEPTDNALRRFAASRRLRILDHDPGIGGRYAALTNVGLLPAMIAGLDGAALRDGAAGVLDAALAAEDAREAPPALGAAIAVTLAAARGVSQMVLMPYVDRLAAFGLWYRQLWAESLGKDGKGTTPVRAVGAVDQHSQLQLYLAGPPDKMFTLIMLEQAGQGGLIPPDLASGRDLAYLAGRRMGDLLEAEQRATATTLMRNGRATRLMRLARLDERSLGALMMHFFLETIIAADLMGVNAFDQPAVEEGKVLARQYLGESGRGGAE
jgi:glucose-6-phosphate isomerase